MKIDIRNTPFHRVASFITDPELSYSYSQDGEDLVFESILEPQKQASGFYVDIGAHHPRRFSNTHLLYMRGWRGINIDATPGSMEVFRSERARDINLEMAVGETTQEIDFYLFDDPALNTCNADRARTLAETTPYQIVGIQKVTVDRLDQILGEHLPPGQQIDLLNIDVEGVDLEVLRSNDWTLYRPRIVLAEDLGTGLAEVMESPICRFMITKGYKPIARLPRSTFYHEAG